MEKIGITTFILACLQATVSAQRDIIIDDDDEAASIFYQAMNALQEPSAEHLPIYLCLGLSLLFVALIVSKAFFGPAKKQQL